MCEDSTDAALVADDVRKAYGDTVALDGVSVSVDAGEVFGLIGPNGAGKTTLVRALTGTTAVEGRVSVLGSAPASVDRARISLLPQSFSPTARLSARELVATYAGLYDDARDVDAVLDDVGLDDVGGTWYENLSGGQRRRACVATALVNDPDLLFLDEPTTGVDPAGRRDLWTLVEGLVDGGTTVFLTSHSMREVERLADRVGLLRDGRIVAAGTPEGLLAEHGGTSRLVVTPVGDARAVELDGFETTVRDGDIVVDDVAPREVTAAVEALDAAGVDYDSLVWRQPSLEDVYLSLTGERFEGQREVTAP